MPRHRRHPRGSVRQPPPLSVRGSVVTPRASKPHGRRTRKTEKRETKTTLIHYVWCMRARARAYRRDARDLFADIRTKSVRDKRDARVNNNNWAVRRGASFVSSTRPRRCRGRSERFARKIGRSGGGGTAARPRGLYLYKRAAENGDTTHTRTHGRAHSQTRTL